jgi:hypothetical protein
MKKLRTVIFWLRLGVAIIGLLLEAISLLQIFTPFSAFDILSNPKLFEAVNLVVIIFLIWWIVEKEWNEYQNKSLKPIICVKNFGVEEKPTFTPLWSTAKLDRQGGFETVKTIFDTLYIDVYNKQKNCDAKRIWSLVEWFDKEMHPVLSHQGRWHIINPENEEKKENLQYIDLYSNRHPERLHFACINKTNYEGYFTGLERDKGGISSWDNPKYRLYGQDGYLVKITLQGNDDVNQAFIFIVHMREGKLDISSGDMWGIKKIPTGEDASE